METSRLNEMAMTADDLLDYAMALHFGLPADTPLHLARFVVDGQTIPREVVIDLLNKAARNASRATLALHPTTPPAAGEAGELRQWFAVYDFAYEKGDIFWGKSADGPVALVKCCKGGWFDLVADKLYEGWIEWLSPLVPPAAPPHA